MYISILSLPLPKLFLFRDIEPISPVLFKCVPPQGTLANPSMGFPKIFCSVSFIQLFQSSAWKFITFILFIDTLAERPYIYRLTLFIYLEYSSPNILIHHLSSDSIIQWEDIWKTINNVNNVHELDISAHPNKQMKYAMYIGLRDILYKPFTFIPFVLGLA